MAQNLLIPVTIRPNGDDMDAITENAALLYEVGLRDSKPFGERELIVRAVPADMDAGDVPAAIEEICEKLRRGAGKCPDAQSARDEIPHTVACKAAIKAGWDTHPKELEAVVDVVISGQVRYCPHGPPCIRHAHAQGGRQAVQAHSLRAAMAEKIIVVAGPIRIGQDPPRHRACAGARRGDSLGLTPCRYTAAWTSAPPRPPPAEQAGRAAPHA